jgi:hypothetical protein
MTNHFASLDLLMQANPMPQEFGTWRSSILCQVRGGCVSPTYVTPRGRRLTDPP